MKKELIDAINYEEKGIKMYEEFGVKFNEAVFNQIVAVKKTGIEFLKSLNLQNSGENLDKDLDKNFDDFENIDDKFDAIFKALSYEIEGENLYKNLVQNEKNDELKDLYFRIWATSVNEYKPALKNLLNLSQKNSGENSHLNPNESGNAFNYAKELNEALNKLKDGKMTPNEALNLLQNPSISFVGGALVGALGGVLLNQFLGKKSDE